MAQIHVIPIDGGEAKQLTHLPMAPSGLKWAREGKLYCIVSTWPDAPDDAAYKKREAIRKDAKSQAYVIDAALYRVWDTWIADGKRPVVFQVDPVSGKHRNLFAKTHLHLPPVYGDATSYDVSPDGKEICFTAESVPDIGADFNEDLFTMPTDGSAKPVNITPDNSWLRHVAGLLAGRDADRLLPSDDEVLLRRPDADHGSQCHPFIGLSYRKTPFTVEWTKDLDRNLRGPIMDAE